MLIIGLGVCLIALGLIGIPLSDRVEIQKRQDWALVGQRAGASISSFTLTLSPGDYYLGVSVWVHNSAEGFYSVSDANGTEVAVIPLANTDQSSEWKYNEINFHLVDSGYYTFELFNATFSNTRSTAKLYQRTYLDEYIYPYRSLLWVGIFSLAVGVPLAIVGLAGAHVHVDSKAK
jgi:hypothetical protein